MLIQGSMRVVSRIAQGCRRPVKRPPGSGAGCTRHGHHRTLEARAPPWQGDGMRMLKTVISNLEEAGDAENAELVKVAIGDLEKALRTMKEV